MKLYADYEFYVTEYDQNLSEEEFNRHIKEATAYIRRLTLRKSDGFTGEPLRFATCAVVEALRDIDKKYPNGVVVSSENNDGFSQSFVTGGESFSKVKSDAEYNAAKMWLSGTGLLSRRAVTGHVHRC